MVRTSSQSRDCRHVRNFSISISHRNFTKRNFEAKRNLESDETSCAWCGAKEGSIPGILKHHQCARCTLTQKNTTSSFKDHSTHGTMSPSAQPGIDFQWWLSWHWSTFCHDQACSNRRGRWTLWSRQSAAEDWSIPLLSIQCKIEGLLERFNGHELGHSISLLFAFPMTAASLFPNSKRANATRFCVAFAC